MPSFLSKFAGCTIFRTAKDGIALFACIAIALSAFAQSPALSARAQAAARQYHHAELLRRHLLAQPESDRTQGAYESVLNAYRAVYHRDPAATEAPDSIVAVAELLQTEGRQFSSPKDFQAAIGQYEFLRQQYPTSSLRYRALLAEAAIQRDDLHDPHTAARVDREFLHLYPHHELAAQARADLNTLQRPASQLATTSSTPTRVKPSLTHARQILAAGFRAPATPVKQVLAVETSTPIPSVPAMLQSIRYWSTASYTRVAIDLSHPVDYESSRTAQPDRIVFHLAATRPAKTLSWQPVVVHNDHFLRAIHIGEEPGGTLQVALDVTSTSDATAFLLPNPDRLIIDIHAATHARPSFHVVSISARAVNEKPTDRQEVVAQPYAAPTFQNAGQPLDAEERSATPPPATSPLRPTSVVSHMLVLDNPSNDNASNHAKADTGHAVLLAVAKGRPAAQHAAQAINAPAGINSDTVSTDETENSMTRVLGLKVRRIVIDAGHGGHDSGTLGPHGLEEKDVVLDVALRLGKLLEDRLGAQVIYTRRDDTFIPLETRTAIANEAKADLFLSIHANSSPNKDARGVETYFLNFTASPDALAVASRENAASNKSVYELSDLVRKITLSNKIEESRTFAMDVQQSLYDGLEPGNPGLQDRGVKQAPFVVLIGAHMPSILAEISFLTNPRDASELRHPAYRQRTAEALYRGVAEYVDSMGGMRIAENTNKTGR